MAWQLFLVSAIHCQLHGFIASLEEEHIIRYRIAGYFRGVYISRKQSQSSKIKIVRKQLMWEEAWFSISIREITFHEQELNWLFAKYKRLENNPLYGIALQ